MMERLTDEQLLRVSANDHDAFITFYRRHVELVDRWFVRRSPEPETAHDLTAETFAEAFRSVGRFRSKSDGSGLAWLFSIARHKLHSFYRSQRSETRARQALGMPIRTHYECESDDVVDRLEAAEVGRDLVGSLRTLPAVQRDAVRARVLDGLSYPEAARRLGCSEVAVRVRVLRALRRLALVIREAPTSEASP